MSTSTSSPLEHTLTLNDARTDDALGRAIQRVIDEAASGDVFSAGFNSSVA